MHLSVCEASWCICQSARPAGASVRLVSEVSVSLVSDGRAGASVNLRCKLVHLSVWCQLSQLVYLSVCGASWCICQSGICGASWCICQSSGPAGASVSIWGQLVHLSVWGPTGASVSLVCAWPAAASVSMRGQLVHLSVCVASWFICQSSGPAGASFSLVSAGPAGASVTLRGQLVHLLVSAAS